MGDYSQAESRVVAWRGPVPRMRDIFKRGSDIHLEVAKTIARVVQENKIILPNKLFMKTPWDKLTAANKDERQIGKTTGHANNYGLGSEKFAMFTGLPEKYAKIIQTIYHSQFPEIRGGYQQWIENELRRTRTLVTALGRPKVFYDIFSNEMLRMAYAYYPQSTVGDLLTQTIVKTCECFEEVAFDDAVIWTPARIRQAGLDVRLNVHDAVYVSVPNDPESIAFAVNTIKKVGEIPLVIGDDTLVIPMDFKVGVNMGELRSYTKC